MSAIEKRSLKLRQINLDFINGIKQDRDSMRKLKGDFLGIEGRLVMESDDKSHEYKTYVDNYFNRHHQFPQRNCNRYWQGWMTWSPTLNSVVVLTTEQFTTDEVNKKLKRNASYAH